MLSEGDLRGLEDFASSGDKPVGWVGVDSIRVAEYWRITYKDQPVQTPDGRSRVFRIPAVKMSKITATEELEHYDWVGSRIPLVPILGEEFNIDGRVFLRGLIEPGMDAQRMVNYTYSGAVEIFALGSKSQYVAADDQVADYKGIWQTANTINWAYLPYKPLSVSGRLAATAADTSKPRFRPPRCCPGGEEDARRRRGGGDSLGANTQRTPSGARSRAIQQSELGVPIILTMSGARRFGGRVDGEIAPITRAWSPCRLSAPMINPSRSCLGSRSCSRRGARCRCRLNKRTSSIPSSSSSTTSAQAGTR